MTGGGDDMVFVRFYLPFISGLYMEIKTLQNVTMLGTS